MKISDPIIDRKILDLGMDDTTGLYEVILSMDPSLSVADKYEAADRRVRELLRGGHIQLVRQFLGESERVTPIEAADIDTVLRSPAAWYPVDYSTEISTRISYLTTDSGAQLYEKIFEQTKTMA